MFSPNRTLPAEELALRWAKCREHLAEFAPDAGGLLTFSRLNIFYLTGHLGQGVCWLPLQGEPLLLVRKGLDRARLESPLEKMAPFKSYSQLAGLCADAGSPLPDTVAVETAGLSWQLGQMLTAKLKGVNFVPGDQVLALARSRKSEWELEIMRRCGALHHDCLYRRLPEVIRPGMTEREISHKAWEVFYAAGHMGLMRMGAFGEEIFLGHVCAGETGNYPSAFNGPLGVMGEHPAIPYMGNAAVSWEPGAPLACDIGFSLEGYCTDKTQIYFAGSEADIPAPLRAAHDFCMDVQAWVAENMKPGTLPSELYAGCLDMAEKAGMAEGFMGAGDNQVVFVGHGIGLAIDGYPVIARGFDRPLEVGNVLAVEPKQAVPGLGMVGVENTFEVTETGGKCITGDAYGMVCVG